MVENLPFKGCSTYSGICYHVKKLKFFKCSVFAATDWSNFGRFSENTSMYLEGQRTVQSTLIQLNHVYSREPGPDLRKPWIF